MDDAMRCGYICRNPMKVGYWNHENSTWISASHKMSHQTITGISLAGESGLGKSHTLRTISDNTPQVIQHSNYRPPDLKQARKVPGLESLQAEQKFSHIQITHLIVECPAYSQSPKNMAKAIFAAADEALQDTDYYNRYGRGSVTDLENNAHRLARNHSLGVLWIDEVRRLMDSKPTINFLVSLNNIIRVPIVLVGTEQSVAMFKKDRSIARRGNKFGDHYWKRINWNDAKGRRDWCNFIKSIEPYQVLKKFVKMNDDFCKLIWIGSGVIPDYAVKIFRQAQCRALECGIEELSSDLITSVSDTLSFSNDFLINPDEPENT
jgi:hypothetical protein